MATMGQPFGATTTAMKQGKGHATRVLTALQRKRRTARQAAGITDVRKATPEQIATARADGLLPQHVLVALQQARRQRSVNASAASGDVATPGKVPPGTPHAVQQALALRNVSGGKVKNDQPAAGMALPTAPKVARKRRGGRRSTQQVSGFFQQSNGRLPNYMQILRDRNG